MPVVRAIVREADTNDYRFSSLVIGHREQRAFQMNRKPRQTTAALSAAKIHNERTMFITGKHISEANAAAGLGRLPRAAAARFDGSGAAAARHAAALPKAPRFVGIFSPHGWAPDYWRNPSNTGAVSEFPSSCKPLEAWREYITVISGLDATSSMPPPGTAGGDHSRSAAVFSGVPPKKTVSDDIYLGTTIDQMIAQKYGQDTALPSHPARH